MATAKSTQSFFYLPAAQLRSHMVGSRAGYDRYASRNAISSCFTEIGRLGQGEKNDRRAGGRRVMMDEKALIAEYEHLRRLAHELDV